MARYLVTGSTIVNDMLYPDGRRVNGFLGGSIYTVNGILPYTDDVLYISVAGPDFDLLYGDYFRRNGLSADGVDLRLPKTLYNIVEYSVTGQWHEYSVYGREFEEQLGDNWEVRSEQVVKHGGSGVKGIYFESELGEKVWKGLDAMREACPEAVFMWEVFTSDAELPEKRDDALKLIMKMDMFSINLPEAKSLFGVDSEEEAIDSIIATGKPCFFRVGTKGSYMIQNGRAWFAPSVDADTSVDATGCGNCSTGASLYGYCEGFHPLKTAVYANVAAGVNARQYGPFPHYSCDIKEGMKETADKMFKKLFCEAD